MSDKNKQELESMLSSLKEEQADAWPAAIRDMKQGSPPAEAGMSPEADKRIARVLEDAVAASVSRERDRKRAGQAGSVSRPAFARRWAGFAAAASLLLALGSLFFFIQGDEPEFTTLSSAGKILVDGKTELRPGAVLAHGTRLDMNDKSLLYAGLGNRLRLRIAGPARVRYINKNDVVEIFLEQGRLEVRSGGAKLRGFRVATARSRIELRGTMFALEVSDRGETTRLLEGRLRISANSGSARELGKGEKLRVLADGRREKTPLSKADVRELDRIRSALASAGKLRGKTESDGPATARSLEDIRALYGFVSEYELGDGRRLKGYLLTREGRSYIHTVDGMIPVRQSDIRSMNLIE